MVLSDTTAESDDSDDSGLFRPAFSRRAVSQGLPPPASAPSQSSASASASPSPSPAAATATAERADGNGARGRWRQKQHDNGGAGASAGNDIGGNRNGSGGDGPEGVLAGAGSACSGGKTSQNKLKLERKAMAMRRRRLVIDDDDDASTCSSDDEEEGDDDDDVDDDDSNAPSDGNAHSQTDDTRPMASSSSSSPAGTSATLNLTLGTPSILHHHHHQHQHRHHHGGSAVAPAGTGAAAASSSGATPLALALSGRPIDASGDDSRASRASAVYTNGSNGSGGGGGDDVDKRGLIAALEGLALSPVGVVGTPIGTTAIGSTPPAATGTPPAAPVAATPAAPVAATPPCGVPLDASASVSANANSDSDQNGNDAVGCGDTLEDTDGNIIGKEENARKMTSPLPVQTPATGLDDTANNSSSKIVQTPAQRRLDNMRKRYGGNKRTPLRLEDLNYESGDDDSDVGEEEEEEETESEAEADDDIFQTSYYVPSGRRKKKEASTGGTYCNGRNDGAMTKPREPAQLLVDTDDEEDDDDVKSEAMDDDASYSTSSSSSSGITISDDEGKIGNAGTTTNEIGNLFRDGLKISSPTTPDHSDDDSKSASSEEVPALVLSPLDPSPDRVDMTSIDDDDSKPSSEPADSAWTHDAEADEVYLSGSGSGAGGSSMWPNLRLPAELYQRLYPHQKIGVQWMASMHRGGVGGILGDDMGLGKTFQTLTYLGGLMRARTIRNALIICPVSVIRTWEREGETILRQSCVPKINICVVSSDVKKHRRAYILQDALHCSKKRPHLVITSYGLVSNSPLDFVSQEQGVDVGGAWDYVVVDEGHKMKNPNTQVSKACRRICKGRSGDDSKTRRLLLTGTPIQNNLKELWALFDFATSGRLLGPLRRFQNSYGDPIEAGRMKNATEWTIRIAEKANKELQAKLRPHFLQRLKSSEFKETLPTKRELVVFTHLSEKQRLKYDQFLAGGMVASILTGETASPLEAITWLKKLCGHPYLVDKTGHSSICELGRKRLVEDSAKLHVLHDLLLRLNDSGHRTLVFSQSTKMLDIIQRVMSQKLTLSRIDGQTKEKDRQRSVDAFNTDGSNIDCMLLSTKAAGIGLTLTGADRAVIFDPSWNSADDCQAVDRCFRIGQTKNVTVYRFITAGSVEEAIYRKVVHKDGIKQTVIGAGGSATERHFDKDDLRKIFTLGPPGECEMLSMITRKAGDARNAVGASGKPSFLESHPGVVGLSSHDKLYTNSVIEIDNEPETPFAGTPLRKQSKAVGPAQRVLAENSNTRTKLDFGSIIDEDSPAPNKPIDLSSERKPLARISNKDKEGKKSSAATSKKKSSSEALDLATALRDVDTLLDSGRNNEDAMSKLLDLLESGTVNGPEKLSLHKKIAATATKLGWL